MKRIATKIPDLYILEPQPFYDDRGYFMESYYDGCLGDLDVRFVQDNESCSKAGVLRGLHFQKPPYAQGKLVRVIRGAVLDVAVDIRRSSPTYGQYVSVELNEENKRLFWIPAGFAHGFCSLCDHTLFAYKCTAPYHKASEGGILWNDPQLNIHWEINAPIVSPKDNDLPTLHTFTTPFD